MFIQTSERAWSPLVGRSPLKICGSIHASLVVRVGRRRARDLALYCAFAQKLWILFHFADADLLELIDLNGKTGFFSSIRR